MLHLFADPSDMQGDLLRITGPDLNHIRNVMRLKPGDEISVSNGVDRKEYRYGIERYEDDAAVCRLRFVKDADVEPPVEIYLFQGLPKSDKMDFVVQKAVELGVTCIIPVRMERCVMKLDDARAVKKVTRWQAIAESAASQSRRRIIPEVKMPMSMEEAVSFARDDTHFRMVPYELQKDDGSTKEYFESIRREIEKRRDGNYSPASARNADSAENDPMKGMENTGNLAVSIFIGPEGGFTPDEIAMAKEAGIRPISLGRRILRTETAPLVVLSWLIYVLEIE